MFQDFCIPDFIVKPEEIEYLKKYHQLHGVYILFAQREPLYVGKSNKIYHRLRSHLLGHSSSTAEHIKYVDEIGLHFTSNNGYAEMAYITEYNPPLNIHRTKWLLSSYIKTNKFNRRCKSPSSRNPEYLCGNEAHLNGYCAWHGGNGITIQSKAEEEADNIIKNNIQLKLII